jgi:uncharacterized protein involved in outer membrane biogenesis
MGRWKKIILIAFGTMAVLALFAATVLPVLVRNKAVEVLREATGRNVRIEKIILNPLTLTASVRGFAIEEKGGGPFFSVGAIHVSVSPASLYRHALVLSEVGIDSPSLRIVRVGAILFNFTDIAEHQKKKEEQSKPTGLFPFVLNNFRLTGGSLDLDDRAVAGGRKHTVRNLDIVVPWLSSLPADAEKDAEPRISLVINAAPLTLGGKIQPFSRDLKSSIHVALQKLSLPELAVYVPQVPPVDLVSGKFTLDADLYFRRAPDGNPEFSAKGLARLGALDLNLGKGQPPQFSVASLALRKGRVHSHDDLPKSGCKVSVEEIALAVKNVAFNGKNGLSVERGNLALKNLSVRYGDSEGLDLASLTIDDATFQQQANRLEIDRINLSRGTLSFSREANGKLSVQSLLLPREETQPTEKAVSAPARAAVPAKREAAKPLIYRVQRLEVEGFNVAFTDKARPQKPCFTLGNTNLSLAELSGPEPRPAKFLLTSTFGKETPLRAAGDLTPNPFRCKGDLRIGRLPIRDFEAYYPENLNLRILGGLLDATMAVDIALKEGTATGSFKGNMGLGTFHAVDAVEEEDLLKWQRLQVDGIDGDLKPLRVAIGQVSLNEVFSRIIIREDGTLNLQNLIQKEEKAGGAEKPGPVPGSERKPQAVTATTTQPPTTAANVPPAPEKAVPRAISIGAVTVANGTIDFIDKHLPNNFETTFYNLGGRISGLSSEASLLADVDLRGNLENHSPLRIIGKINPLREDLFVDLKLTFSDIELSPMSPYTETYLGYILKQGKLFLDLQYHIEDKKLVSENKIRIEQFTFGDKVESDKATSLPVKLGLALLKDRRGEINLDVPVTGRIDDPRFSIWRLVFQALKNLLVKAVTAPFSLLSSLFAEGGDLSAVAFAPGSSILQPSEEKKLEALARGLDDRPALKVSLTAYVDREKDAEGYRNELLERKLKREKFLALTRERQIAPGETAGTMTLTPVERSAYLKRVYAKEKFPKPRNVLGMEISLPDPEMVKLILANTKVDRNELEDLARERANAVRDFLIGKGNVAAERIFEKNDDIFKPPAKSDAPQSRVELNALGS